MAKRLEQSELNAATVIRGLVDLNLINFETDFGFGKETREMVLSHLAGWDYHNRKQLKVKLQALLDALK